MILCKDNATTTTTIYILRRKSELPVGAKVGHDNGQRYRDISAHTHTQTEIETHIYTNTAIGAGFIHPFIETICTVGNENDFPFVVSISNVIVKFSFPLSSSLLSNLLSYFLTFFLNFPATFLNEIFPFDTWSRKNFQENRPKTNKCESNLLKINCFHFGQNQSDFFHLFCLS